MSMNMEKGQNGLKPVPPTFEKASTIQKILAAATVIALIAGLSLVFLYAPVEKVMGMVQKIFLCMFQLLGLHSWPFL